VQAFQTALMGTGLRVMLGEWQNLAPKSKFQEACRLAHQYLEHFIQQARNENGNERGYEPRSGSKTRSMIQGLTEQTDDIRYIRSQILQGMMASQETTAVLISNAMFLLARDPKEWEKLRVEVAKIGDRILDFNTLSTSKVLQNILSECEFGLLITRRGCVY
jgi:cytochrome P450